MLTLVIDGHGLISGKEKKAGWEAAILKISCRAREPFVNCVVDEGLVRRMYSAAAAGSGGAQRRAQSAVRADDDERAKAARDAAELLLLAHQPTWGVRRVGGVWGLQPISNAE